MLKLTAVFFAAMGYVSLRSWQQLNVVRRKYALIMPTSLAMAAGDVFLITSIAQEGFGLIVLAFGLGGGLGSVIATYAHHRWIRA